MLDAHRAYLREVSHPADADQGGEAAGRKAEHPNSRCVDRGVAVPAGQHVIDHPADLQGSIHDEEAAAGIGVVVATVADRSDHIARVGQCNGRIEVAQE